MTSEEQIVARLAEFAPVYEEIGKMLKQLAALQQAELAQDQHTQQTAKLDEEIKRLTAKYKALEGPQQQAKMEEAGVRRYRSGAKSKQQSDTAQSQPLRDIPRPRVSDEQALQTARTDLKKIVGRWGHYWKLTGDTQGRINRIADDPARPLGEALALLNWSTFQNPIGSEGVEVHLKRLVSWGAALVEYRERLLGEIDMLKTKYRLVIPILNAWIQRDTAAGRQSWEQQIEETNAAKEKEAERLRHEIARLTAQG